MKDIYDVYLSLLRYCSNERWLVFGDDTVDREKKVIWNWIEKDDATRRDATLDLRDYARLIKNFWLTENVYLINFQSARIQMVAFSLFEEPSDITTNRFSYDFDDSSLVTRFLHRSKQFSFSFNFQRRYRTKKLWKIRLTYLEQF